MARTLGAGKAAAWLGAIAPAWAVAQGRTLPDPVPPGGLSLAWPLGIIVALVALVAVAGGWLARRRRGTAAGPPRGAR